MSGRWIRIYDSLLHGRHRFHPHSTGESACKAFAWIDLIGLAVWRDEGGLRRGQARASQRYLAARWNWSRGKVARFLDELTEDGAIERASGASREPDRITICNYDEYQSSRSTNGSADGSTSEATGGATDRAKEVDVDVEVEETEGSVSTKPAEPDVDNSPGEESWNDRLAPTARQLGGEKNIGRWLRWGRENPDEAERVMLGVLSLRDRGAIDYCAKPGDPCSPGILSVKYEGQPVRRYAEAEYFRVTRPDRKGPRRTNVEPERVNVA